MKNILLKEELKTIVKSRKILIPIIAVMLVPVLYAGMFLWAFWNPYGKMNDLPVAIVNEDAGAIMDGEHLTLGADLAKKLEKSREFGFKTIGKKEGYKALKNQQYYMLIEIPKDFSKNATTLLEVNPKKLELIYTPNESFNFLSAQIGGTAAEKIKTAVAEKVTQTYAETMFDKVTELADGIKKASDGAGQLSTGSKDLDKGSREINEGLMTLAEKSLEFENGVKSADAGAKKLATGSKYLYDGLATLAEKSFEFNHGVKEAETGSKSLASGSVEIKNGLAKADASMPLLVDGSNKAYAGAEQLKNQLPAGIAAEISKKLTGSVGELSSGIDSFQSQLTAALAQQIAEQTIAKQSAKMQELASVLVANGVSPTVVNGIMANEQKSAPTKEQVQAQIASELTPGLNQAFGQFKTGVASKLAGSAIGLEDQIKAQTNPYFDQLLSGIGQINSGQKDLQKGIQDLYAGAAKLNDGASQLSTGMRKLSTGAGQLADGASQLTGGSQALNTGADSLATGMNQLVAGSDALSTGAKKLEDGSGQLKDGTEKLSDGAEQLAQKLSDGAIQASKVHSDQKTYDMMAKPVQLETKKLNHVPNYGTGFTPYFLSLGLFVGALLLSIVFPLREPAVTPTGGFNWFVSKFSILAFIGIIQALIADAIILAGLGLDVQSIPKFILFSIITSLTFIALIQLLVTVFADAGRFLAIVILILQLTTSAGTFPLELIPNFLQKFNTLLPMTYSVRGFKAVISSGDFSYMWDNFMILAGYVLSFGLCTTVYLSMRFKHKFKNLSHE